MLLCYTGGIASAPPPHARFESGHGAWPSVRVETASYPHGRTRCFSPRHSAHSPFAPLPAPPPLHYRSQRASSTLAAHASPHSLRSASRCRILVNPSTVILATVHRQWRMRSTCSGHMLCHRLEHAIGVRLFCSQYPACYQTNAIILYLVIWKIGIGTTVVCEARSANPKPQKTGEKRTGEVRGLGRVAPPRINGLFDQFCSAYVCSNTA